MALLRWESHDRYYAATIQPDLFGGLVVQQCWGGLYNNLGGMKSMPVETMAEAKKALYTIAQRRKRRQYCLVR